jgi:zinc protease
VNNRNLLLAAIAILMCSASALAQGTPDGAAGQSVRGAQLKNKAPINTQTLHINLPKPVEAQLANGLRVVLIEDRKLPTFYMQAVLLDRGDALDPKSKQGLTRATAAQLREGTTTRTAQQLSEELDVLGGSLNGFSGTLDSYVAVAGLSEHFDKLLNLFADVLLNPTFPDSELQRYKARLLSQLQAQRAQPAFLAREQLYKAVYGEHPASVVAPPDEDVKRLSVDDLKAFHERYYRPNATLLLVTGDVTMKELLPKLEASFKNWQPNEVKPEPLPSIASPETSQVFVVDRPGSVQTALLLGALSIKGDDADRMALSVMNQVLGASAASRLFMNLREDKGYTYGAYSSISQARYPGVVAASAEVRTDVTDAAMKEFMYELTRIGTEPVTAVELANAKRALVGRFALALENPSSFIDNVFEQKIYGFPKDYWDHYAERIDAITAADVQRVATKYVDPARLQIVAVGDASKIREAMMKYGTNK